MHVKNLYEDNQRIAQYSHFTLSTTVKLSMDPQNQQQNFNSLVVDHSFTASTPCNIQTAITAAAQNL